MDVDLKVAQLLCSRLCHDLVGPAGAAHNGIELLDEMGAGGGGEALTLIGGSVRQLSTRLAFFRFAFGHGGLSGRKPTLEETRDLAQAFLAGGRTTLDWPLDAIASGIPEFSAHAAKLLLNMVLVGVDALPRGGSLGVSIAEIGDDAGGKPGDKPGGKAIGMAVRAAGSGARLKEDLSAALAAGTASGASEDALTAHNVHGYFCQKMAGTLGCNVEVSEGDDEVQLAVLVPGNIGG